jgi:ATP-dependent Zn protease
MRKSTLKKMKAARTACVENQAKEKLQIDIMQAAMHEAGHALAYQLLLNGVEYAHVERKVVVHDDAPAFSSGFTQPNERKLSRETIELEAVCCLAGPAAEDSVNGDGVSSAHGDIDNLRNCAVLVGLSREEAKELTERAYRAAKS